MLNLQDLAARLIEVPGVVGVMLGGSRARGTHTEDSDVDLGLYYRPELDVAALGDLAREVAGPDAAVTRPGEWGPWVDGGGWLRIDDTPVDWIYRDLDRVAAAWARARAGQFSFHFQVGHPLGFPDFAYPGEVALGRVLADPTGELTRLRSEAVSYPAPLRERVVKSSLWEANFALTIARKAAGRGDTTYVAGCLFRGVGLCAPRCTPPTCSSRPLPPPAAPYAEQIGPVSPQVRSVVAPAGDNAAVASDELTIDDWMAEAGLPEGRPRRITMYETPVLHAPCRPVTVFDDALKQLVADLFESMDAAEGVGLAANQIGVDAAIFVYDCPDADDVFQVGCVVNPVLVPPSPDVPRIEEEEGCLSVPLEFATLSRPAIASVTGVDVEGRPIRVDGTGLFARCLQHETDHLNGIMYVDRLDPEQRDTVMSGHQQRLDNQGMPPWSAGFVRR